MTDRPAVRLSCDEVRDLAPGFVLGALEPLEMAGVREHLAACPEAHEELAELGGVVPYLADSLEPMTPPVALRGRILAAVAAEASSPARDAAAPALAVAPALPSVEAVPAAALISIDAERSRRRSPLGWISAVAAVLIIVGLGAWNISLRHDLEGAQAYGAAVDRVLTVAAAPGGQTAILAPAEPGGPSGIAAIGSDGKVEIAVRDLDPTTGTQVYEAWVIGADKTPVAIGSFVPGTDGFGTLTTGQAPSAPGVIIALTREPSAGRTAPTPPVLSSGVAAGST